MDYNYIIAGFVGGLIGRIIYKIDKYFTEKETPKPTNILIYEKDYRSLKTTLIFYAPLNGPEYLEPPEWVCKKDATYKFVIG